MNGLPLLKELGKLSPLGVPVRGENSFDVSTAFQPTRPHSETRQRL